MLQNSEVDICKCGDYCQLKTLKSLLNLGRRFFGCRAQMFVTIRTKTISS